MGSPLSLPEEYTDASFTLSLLDLLIHPSSITLPTGFKASWTITQPTASPTITSIALPNSLHLVAMSTNLQQSLVDLESSFKQGKASAAATSQKLGKLKVS